MIICHQSTGKEAQGYAVVLSNAFVPGIFCDGDVWLLFDASPDGAMLICACSEVICPGPESGSGFLLLLERKAAA